MTKKLYYDDLYAREFDAEVLNQYEHDGKFYVTLNQTLFYPGGGGQPCDLGFIEFVSPSQGEMSGTDREVVEVLEVIEDGENIIHVLNHELQNKNVHGVLNWDRRFELMQQHLGEHIFAGMLYNLHGLHTARMRIEGDNVSIDIDTQTDENVIFEAEAAANEAVWKDIPVEILYPSMDEVKANARKLPPEKSTQPIRIVKIQDVDYVPCCGVHVNSTGQVGLIKITSFENHKGGKRIYLKSGRAAYRWVKSVNDELRKAEAELVCGYEGINEKILSLKSQIHDLKTTNENNIERFLRPLAEDLIKNSNSKIIRHVMKDTTQDEVKILFRMITEINHDVVVLFASESSEGIFLMFGCNRENKKVDIRPAFRKAIEILEGKGGGSSFSAQGFCSVKNSEKLNYALDEAEKILFS